MEAIDILFSYILDIAKIFTITFIGYIIKNIYEKQNKKKEKTQYLLECYHEYVMEFINYYDMYIVSQNSGDYVKYTDTISKIKKISNNMNLIIPKSELNIDKEILAKIKILCRKYSIFLNKYNCIKNEEIATFNLQFTQLYIDSIDLKNQIESDLK